MRRVLILGLLGVLAFTSACTNKKVNNPLANVGSKQPDKVLFDRSMDAMKHNRFDVARMTLQTLINTYPDSEFIARAKLAVADSWYAEGGSTALQQAEIEYKDFKTFFPNMPEAAEAQLKVANIHYQQMEKADRDFTHAMRAEQEYRNLMQEYPDSKLVKQAKVRLLEVQEVLAQREYNIGRFYFLRQAFPAAIARLQTLVERYPLYSRADEALYLIGQSHEEEIARIRAAPTCSKTERIVGCISEEAKANMISSLIKQASAAYARIIQRYPAMDRALDAKARLEALNQPVPRPTRAAMELNKKEVASRSEPGFVTKLWGPFDKHPDVSPATKVGEPTMTDGPTITAGDVVLAAAGATGSGSGDTAVKAQTINAVPAPNQEPPRSDAPPASAGGAAALAAQQPPDSAAGQAPAQAADQPPAAGELKPNVSDPKELVPNVANQANPPSDPNALPPPTQTNEITAGDGTSSAKATTSSNKDDELVDLSSSKPKKKGLKKLNPF
jgi:outer membrane protein assembly factor BamD